MPCVPALCHQPGAQGLRSAGVDEDFTAAARRLLPPEELAMANDECLLRIDEQIDFEPDDSVRMASLQQGRARFAPTPGETV